jgi:hypothetical protein
MCKYFVLFLNDVFRHWGRSSRGKNPSGTMVFLGMKFNVQEMVTKLPIKIARIHVVIQLVISSKKVYLVLHWTFQLCGQGDSFKPGFL